jgi:hypothetical protein
MSQKIIRVKQKIPVSIGTKVRVTYPDYATGIRGCLQAQEPSGRWIVQLEKNPFSRNAELLFLSLEESDFEVITS